MNCWKESNGGRKQEQSDHQTTGFKQIPRVSKAYLEWKTKANRAIITHVASCAYILVIIADIWDTLANIPPNGSDILSKLLSFVMSHSHVFNPLVTS